MKKVVPLLAAMALLVGCSGATDSDSELVATETASKAASASPEVKSSPALPYGTAEEFGSIVGPPIASWRDVINAADDCRANTTETCIWNEANMSATTRDSYVEMLLLTAPPEMEELVGETMSGLTLVEAAGIDDVCGLTEMEWSTPRCTDALANANAGYTKLDKVLDAWLPHIPEDVEPAPTPTPTPTPTPATPLERELSISCWEESGGPKTPYTSLTDAWAGPPGTRLSCEVDDVTVESDQEQTAIELADYGPESLGLLYSMCAEYEMGNAGQYGPRPFSEPQRVEMEGVFALCPEHPEIEVVRGYMDAAAEEAQLEAEGKIVYSGTHKVGEGILVGTYVGEWDTAVDGCYWETVDANGGTIDNDFINSAFRVQFTVPANAYSVTIDGCGGFRLVE